MTGSNEKRLTVAVIGLGSIGGVVAGCLREADRHDVIACVRSPLPRLTLERPGAVVDLDLKSLTDPATARPVDWVLLCTKVYQTPSCAPWLAKLCGPHTRVAVLQNGMGHAERVGPMAGEAVIVPTIVYFNGERLGPDRVRLRPVSDHDIEARDDADGRAFAALFADTPIRVFLSEDFVTLAWRKLLVNATANPITALTLQRQAVLRRDDIKALCFSILDEAVAVAKADGARLDDDEAAQVVAKLMTYPPEAGTSMYFDRLAGKPIEAEALSGAIVAAGERHGIATPLNRALLALLRAIGDAASVS